MKRILFLGALLVCAGSFAEVRGLSSEEEGRKEPEPRTWSSADGQQTVEGTYSAVSGDKVLVRDADGKIRKLPLSILSEEDRLYVEYKNPPEIKVEYREDAQPVEVVADVWVDNGNGSHENHPIKVTDGRFGAEIIQQRKPSVPYNHKLVAEVYVLTRQRYDPSKYKILAYFKSDEFMLTKENEFRYEFMSKGTYQIVESDLYSEHKRGEELAEYLVLVRDENGDIVDYNGSKNWMKKYLERLEKLPVGAWINDKCIRVHTTSPEWWYD